MIFRNGEVEVGLYAFGSWYIVLIAPNRVVGIGSFTRNARRTLTMSSGYEKNTLVTP